MADSACSCLQTLSVSCVVRAWHALPRIEYQLNDGLDRFLFKIDAHVDLDAAIVSPLLHSCKEVTTICINIFPFGGIEELPNAGEVMAIVDSGKAHQGCNVILCVPFGIGIVLPP
jgi:hypothetical protein